MVLENEKCHIEIKIDKTYTLNSADNQHYDIVLNPCQYTRRGTTTTFSISVHLPEREYKLALVGPFYSYDFDCAVLENETLTVLQDRTITQINIMDGSILAHKKFECFGCNYAIYKVEKGYVIYGEIEITMLDLDFQPKWHFMGKDVFSSFSHKQPFELKENVICLYDLSDNYYEIDYDGKWIR